MSLPRDLVSSPALARSTRTLWQSTCQHAPIWRRGAERAPWFAVPLLAYCPALNDVIPRPLPLTMRYTFEFAFSPDGDRVMIEMPDRLVSVYSTSTGLWLRDLARLPCRAFCMLYAPNGETAACVAGFRLILLPNHAETEDVSQIAFFGDSTPLAMFRGGALAVHHNGAWVHIAKLDGAGLCAAGTAALLLAGGHDPWLVRRDGTTRRVVAARVHNVCFDAHGTRFATLYATCACVLWDTATCTALWQVDLGSSMGIRHIALSLDGVAAIMSTHGLITARSGAVRRRNLDVRSGHFAGNRFTGLHLVFEHTLHAFSLDVSS